MKKAVILNDTSYEFHHGCETVVKNIIKLLYKNGIETIDTNSAGKYWLKNEKFLKNMALSDIVIVNGEGTLHHSQQRALELAPIAKYVKEKLNIPIVLINATYQDNGKEIATLMKYFDLIFVRETLSQKDLKQYDINSEVVPDMTFYTPYDLRKKNETNLIGVTDSIYLDVTDNLYNIAYRNNYKYLPALTNARFRNKEIINVVRALKFHISKRIDFFIWKIGGNLENQRISRLHYIKDYNSYIQQIANLNMLIVGRYHSLCFALKTLTPFVAIKSNSHKIEGILDDVDIGRMRIRDLTQLNQVNDMDFDSLEVEKIRKYITMAPIKIETMFENIKQLVITKV